MKIYREIRFDIDSFDVIYEDSFEYDGPVSLCGGGGGQSTTTVDPIYNAGLLALSKETSAWASKLMSNYFYGADYDPTAKVTGFTKADGTFVDMTKYNGIRWGEHGKGYSPTGEDLGVIRLADGTVTGDPALDGLKFTMDQKWVSKADNTPVEIITTTKGELSNYDDAANTSGAEYEQNSINAQQSLLAGETAASASETALKGETADAKRSLIPSETDAALTTNFLTTERNNANRALVDPTKDAELSALFLARETSDMQRTLVDPTKDAKLSGLYLERETNDMNRSFIPGQTAVGQAFYQSALTGVDPNQRANQAQVDATMAFRNSGNEMRQQAALSGVNPNSGRFASALSNNSLEQAKTIGAARTQGRISAEAENFDRLNTAMGGIK